MATSCLDHWISIWIQPFHRSYCPWNIHRSLWQIISLNMVSFKARVEDAVRSDTTKNALLEVNLALEKPTFLMFNRSFWHKLNRSLLSAMQQQEIYQWPRIQHELITRKWPKRNLKQQSRLRSQWWNRVTIFSVILSWQNRKDSDRFILALIDADSVPVWCMTSKSRTRWCLMRAGRADKSSSSMNWLQEVAKVVKMPANSSVSLSKLTTNRILITILMIVSSSVSLRTPLVWAERTKQLTSSLTSRCSHDSSLVSTEVTPFRISSTQALKKKLRTARWEVGTSS